MIYVLALLIGVVAGLRAMMAPAIVSWSARVGALGLRGTWLGFLGSAWVTWLFTLLALAELVTDQLPRTPSRTVPIQFATRVVTGALSGAAIGLARGSWIGGGVAGMVGAAIGTLGGRAARARTAAALGRDRPAAILEDVIAIGGGLLIVAASS